MTLFEWLPTITIGQGLVLLVATDFIILFVFLIRRWVGKPSKVSPPSTAPTPQQDRKTPYYEIEETTTEGEITEDMKFIAEVLKPLKKNLARYPMPSIAGVPLHIEAMVHKAKDPNLFLSRPEGPPTSRQIDATLRGPNVDDENKRKAIERDMVS